MLPIPEHLNENPSHNFDFGNVQILDREINKYKRLVSEMIHINTHSYTINRQEDTQFFLVNNIIEFIDSLLTDNYLQTFYP